MIKAALCYLRRPMVPGKFSDAIQELLIHEGTLPREERVIDGRIIRLQHPPYPNLGRNKLVTHFLDSYGPEVDRLLMVDDDNPFLPWQVPAILGLLAIERPIVSGLYFAYDEDQRRARPIMLERVTGGYATLWDYPDGLVRRDAVGMGFCGLHRQALEEWRAAHGDTWFDYATRANGEFVIEDKAFCERMRGQGKPIFVHTGIKVGHMKLVEIDESHYLPPTLQRKG